MTDRSAISNDASREEDKAREEEALRKTKEEKRLDVLNDPLIVEYARLKNETEEWRRDTINVLPDFIINHSSNALGALHMSAEMLMLKSAGIDYMTTPEKSRSWHHYLTEPPKNVFKAIVGESGFKRTEPTLLKEVQAFFDVDKASDKDWAKALKAVEGQVDPKTKKPLEAKLINRMQTRATAMGIVGWGLSMVLPENKEKPEEIERMTRMLKENPLGYVGTRMWQAVDFTHWSDNKAQLTGGSVLIGGVFSTLGAWRGTIKGGGSQAYYLNKAYAFQGCLTMLAGAAALLGVTKEDSYRNFGTIMMGKIPLLPANIGKRFTINSKGKTDPNRWYYTGAHGLFQTQNTAGFLIGGAQKAADGTIMDQKAIRDDAKHKVLQEKSAKKDGINQSSTAVSEQQADPKEEKPKDKKQERLLADPFVTEYARFKNEWSEWRRDSIQFLPNFIVNNSSNTVGAAQLVAEALMFKSTGNDFFEIKKILNGDRVTLTPQTPVDYVTFPIRNIFGSVFGRTGAANLWQVNDGGVVRKASEIQDYVVYPLKNIWKALPKTPSAMKEGWLNFVDLKRATAIDSAGGRQLVNNMSARSGFSGILAMTAATLLPDEKDTVEKTYENTEKAKNNPVGYVLERYGQAVNPFAWWEHKRQFAGLGMSFAGGFSALSGLRQIENLAGGAQRYISNPWQIAGGVISFVAGQQLLLSVDSQQAWTNFGQTQLLRLTTLPNSIAHRFSKNEQGADWYLGAQSTMVGKNILASMIGGAEKKDDGTIIDHQEIRKEALKKVQEEMKHKPKKTIFGGKKHETVEHAPLQHKELGSNLA
ncbi:MAG: hypothetical protein ACOYJ2_02705 [Rickettsiales bacterium]